MERMDIKGVLATQRAELLDVDLDCLEDELATGGYDSSYVLECSDAIWRIRHDRADAASKESMSQGGSGLSEANESKGASAETATKPDEAPDGKPELSVNVPLSESIMAVPANELSPYGKPIEEPKLTEGEMFVRQLELIRQAEKPLAELEKYLMGSTFDEAFIERNLSAFRGQELSVVLGCYGFGEDFLERYFNVFDPDGIALTQRFSEEFFMRHYADLNGKTVLEEGINPWRAKGARSKKLDMFLRLKGVHI